MSNLRRFGASGFFAAGGALLVLAGIFLWRDLGVAPEWLVAVVAAAGAAASLLRVRSAPWIATVLSAGSVAAGAFGYLALRRDALLAGLLAAAVAATVTALVGWRDADARRKTVMLGTLIVGGLAASWALYFRVFTLGIAEDHIARRMVLTLGWLIAGVVMCVWSARQNRVTIGHVGLSFVTAALLKVVAYDTSHLAGGLRVATLAASGALLLGAATWMKRPGVGQS
jgi:hypothetical protein